MIFRFSLYGFLKNQRYFEPFMMLFLLGSGNSFATVGFLIGFREFCINATSIPAGVLPRFERETKAELGTRRIDDSDHFHREIVSHDRAFTRSRM